MLTVTGEQTLHIIRANVQSVTYQFSRSHPTIHATGQMPC